MLSVTVNAAEMGVPVQLRLKNPLGNYPTDSGLQFKIQILTPSNGCILREEVFSSQSITDGNISLALGSGTRGPLDPNISLISVYDNVSAKTNLNCVDSNNNVISSNQTYTPAAGDVRLMRVISDISGDHIVADFNMRAAPYALVAESVGGKVAADILTKNASTELNQSNLESLLADPTHYNNLLNIATSGLAISAASATNAVNAVNATNAVNAQTAVGFSGALAGDVTGTQSATVVSKLRGVTISTTAPTSGQVLAYDGSQYVPVTPAAATVSSVNGQTGAVVLTAANIAGVVTSATSLLGDVTGNVSATVVSAVGGKTAAQVATAVNEVNSATALAATANTLVKRDGSGNIVASSILSTSNSTQHVYIYEATNTNSVHLKAPNSFSNYILTLPTTDGNNGEVLQTDGSGNLSWVGQSGAVTSSTIASALGYTPADDSLVMKKSNNLGDVVSAPAARANLGLGGAAVLNVGTTSGTVAAGDDSRIVGALQQSDYNADVASASCTSGQTMYWNSVSGQFACQNIQVSGDISGVASSVTVTKVQGVGVSFSSLASNHILQYNGSQLINRAVPTCGANQYLTFNGSAWSCATDAGSSGVVSSVAVTAPLQTTGGITPTLSMPQATGSVSGYLSGSDWTTFNSKITSSAAAVAQVLGYTPLSSSLVSTRFYVGNGSNVASAVAMSGDATMTYAGVVTLKNVGTAGSYGAADKTLSVTTDAQGRVSSVSQNSISIVAAQVSDFSTEVLGTVLSGLSTATATAVTAADSVLVAVGKLQAQLNTLLNPATTMVNSTGAITTASASDVLMTGMTITPPAGTYQVNFLTSVSHETNGAVISMSLYAGGVPLAGSQTQTTPRVAVGLNNANLTLNQGVIGEVTVNGSQAIEIRWNSSTGTATSTNRMFIINRVR